MVRCGAQGLKLRRDREGPCVAVCGREKPTDLCVAVCGQSVVCGRGVRVLLPVCGHKCQPHTQR